MTTPQPAIRYKEFYNKDRGLPEPKWGGDALTPLQCPTCGSIDMCYSGSPDDPEEILGEAVRCRHCGYITDWYEAHKQKQNYPTDIPRRVIRESPHCHTGQGRYT